jgi:molybdopterin-guanine dinucleotide biosynthesis protein A
MGRAARIDGLLVAGGRSRRFGSDKRRAELGGRTLAERSLVLLRAAIDGDLFIAGRGAFDRSVDAIEVDDADRGAGPAAGIAAALLRSRFGVLVLPCDAPFVTADTLSTIAGLARHRGRAVIARSPRGIEPLVAFYPRTALPRLVAGLREGTRALHRLAGRLGPIFVDVADSAQLLNVNRPGDLDRARARFGVSDE